MSEYVLRLKKTNGDTVTKFVDRNYKLSRNLEVWECCCDATTLVIVDERVVINFQKVRDRVGHSLSVGRLFSTPENNASNPGAWDQSYHLSGQAIDFHSKQLSHQELFEITKEVCGNKGGFGLYDTHVHMDVQDGYWEKDWR